MLTRDALLPSLNEVEALAAKAVRGAGAGWGTAEDVARAARWMARYDLDWASALLALLDAGSPERRLAPVLAIADRLAGARDGDAVALGDAAPVWTVAILAGAVYGREIRVEVAGAGWCVRLRPDGGMGEEGRRVEALPPGDVAVRVLAESEPLPDLPARAAGRRAVPAALWRALEAYAARTYVQPSLRSRQTGAGGGRVDDD